MRRRWFTAGMSVLAATIGFAPAASTAEKPLTYAIQEARAYAFQVPLRKEVIRVIRTFDPCDPQKDPYRCDTTAYNHQPNCPPALADGRTGAVPRPNALPDAEERSGGAGAHQGPGAPPPESSAIAVNNLLSLARIGRFGTVVDASGLASASYVDLSGRQEPEAHTESDAFTPNVRSYEERCFPREEAPDDYVHVLSRSFRAPETYHLSECFRRECTFFGGAALGAEAERGRTIVHLVQEGDRVVGRLEAVLKEASWGDGELRIEQLETVVTFRSDGTPDGLRWSVTTTALGARLGGRPVALPPGRTVGNAELQVGVAAPFVDVAEDGGQLTIVAPGLYVAHAEQSAFFAGAEITGTFGRETPLSLPPLPEVRGAATAVGTGVGATTSFGSGTSFGPGQGLPAQTPSPAGGAAPAPEPAVSVTELPTGAGPMATILALAAAALFLVLVRWIGRYEWGRRLYRVQPLRGLDWLYRAFLKT